MDSMKNRKTLIALLAVLALVVSMLSGCSSKTPEPAATAVPEVTEAPAAEPAPTEEPAANAAPKHLNAASHMVGTSLDAAKNYQGWTVTRAGIGETLLKLNDAVELEACLADSWEWVDDYTLKLHVREGITFHNGKAVDAAAVKASFEHTAEINNRFAMYIDLKEFIADGQYFTIVSNSHNPQMLWNLVEPCFCVMDVTVADIENAPVGTGPYKVVSFEEDHIDLAAYENYWRGRPGLDTITFTKISDAEARVMALQSGEVDVTVTIDNTNLSLFRNDDFNISLITGVRTNVVKMNNQSKFLSNKELRRALS